MQNKEEYFARLKKMKKNLYYKGTRIGRDHKDLQPAMDIVGYTFDMASDPDIAHLCTAASHLNGKTISRFNHVHQSTDDLLKKLDMTRAIANRITICFQRCVGTDALNALNVITYEVDKAWGGATRYHERFVKWLDNFQKKNLVACCAQTDPKGDRKKKPHEQDDPDQYVRVVGRNKDGIIVRGCKLHCSGAPTADEIVVIPGRMLTPEDSAYAVAFAVPSDAEGLKHVINVHNSMEREKYHRFYEKGGGYSESHLIFDDVFVPWDRVFLCGEHLHGGFLALLFSTFRRHSSCGCKPGLVDIHLGLAAMAAQVNGVEKEKHVRKMFVDFIKASELTYAAGYTASCLGKPGTYIPGIGECPCGPGSYIPNAVQANVGRYFAGTNQFHDWELLCNIAGGMPATFPSEKDILNPETGPLLKKYINRTSKMSIDDQIKFWLYFQEVTCSTACGVMSYGYYHGGGSPAMEEVAILSQYDIEFRKDLVKRMIRMGEEPVKKAAANCGA